MNLSIYFAPRIVLNKISYIISMISRVIKSDGQSILFAVIIIIFLGVINLQNYEYSCNIESPSQISKKISMLLLKKNTVVQNLISQNSEQSEKTELMKSQIEMALFSQGSR